MEPDVPGHPHPLEERSQCSDKQGAVERYYALLRSGHSVSATLNNHSPVRNESEHGNTVTTGAPQSTINGVPTNVPPEMALVGRVPEKAQCTRDLSVPLSHETESCRAEEPQPVEGASHNKLGIKDWEQLFLQSLPSSESHTIKSTDAHTDAGRERVIRSGNQKRLRFSKFPLVRKRIVFGALYTAIGVSVSIAGFSIVRDGRDADPTTTRALSGVSSRTEAVAIPDPAAGRSDSVVEVRETGSAPQQELAAPQRSDTGQVDAIYQSTAPATAPRDPTHEPAPAVTQSLSATPKGSAGVAPHPDTAQPLEAKPKDAVKATATVPTKSVSAALPSRAHAADRRRASTPRRDAGSKKDIRRRASPKYP
jgi:hypothetical protein